MSISEPPRWNDQQFEEQLAVAKAAFCEERLREPLEQYREVFDEHAARVRALLLRTDHLTDWTDAFEIVLSDEVGMDVLRYVAGPPISADDLKTLTLHLLRGDSATILRWQPGFLKLY